MKEIVLNTHFLTLSKQTLTYGEILKLANKPTGSTVAHFNRDTKASGFLQPGETLELADRMVITAIPTNNA